MNERIKLILIFFFVILYSSCGNHRPGIDKQDDINIKVDRVVILKDTLNSADTIRVAFWGIIGKDSCYSFSHFLESKSPNQSVLEVWGVHKFNSEVPCKESSVNLDGIIYNIFPLTKGNYSVIVHQPDGSEFEKKVFVH